MSGVTNSISNDFNNVRSTFSSWDSCMAHSYCKWPVIVGIVVGSLILLSVVWCIASCLCCGATLCGSCIRCLSCFHCCGACRNRGGGGGGSGRTRHKDDYSQMPPTPYNGYQPPASSMTYQPQFAQFDASNKKVHADSLPAMPTWENARSVRVEDHSAPTNGFGDDVEMGRMQPTQSQPQSRTRGGYNQVPTGPISPVASPAGYGRFEGQSHPHSSDIGAQRLQPQQTGYSDFNPSPLSPAPTYRTVASIPTVNNDRFNRGAISPGPSPYHNQGHAGAMRDNAWSPLPNAHHDNTDYQSFRRSPSPPPLEHQPLTYGHHYEEESSARPPSLLQIGRKPVMGSQREI